MSVVLATQFEFWMKKINMTNKFGKWTEIFASSAQWVYIFQRCPSTIFTRHSGCDIINMEDLFFSQWHPSTDPGPNDITVWRHCCWRWQDNCLYSQYLQPFTCGIVLKKHKTYHIPTSNIEIYYTPLPLWWRVITWGSERARVSAATVLSQLFQDIQPQYQMG